MNAHRIDQLCVKSMYWLTTWVGFKVAPSNRINVELSSGKTSQSSSSWALHGGLSLSWLAFWKDSVEYKKKKRCEYIKKKNENMQMKEHTEHESENIKEEVAN